MTIQQIGYFLKLAEELNYTNVARIFFITQPTLSKQIVNLENELKVTLFFRDHNSVQLTLAGKKFYDRVKPIFLNLMDAIRDAQSCDDERDNLVIGIQEEQLVSNSFMLAINKLHHLYPDLKIAIHRDEAEKLLEGLKNGKYDILNMLLLPTDGNYEDLNVEKIENESTYLAYAEKLMNIPEMISKDELVEILRQHDIILPFVRENVDDSQAKNYFLNEILKGVDTREFNVKVTQSGRAISLPIQVASQLGVSLCNKTNLFSIDPKIKMSMIEDTEGSYFKGLVYRKIPGNPYIKVVVKMTLEELKSI